MPSYTPVQVARGVPVSGDASGAGQTIGIIELGGGYRQADLTAYFKTLGQTAPAITAVAVDGGKNAPSTASGADGEVMLDIEVAAIGRSRREDRRLLRAEHRPGLHRRHHHRRPRHHQQAQRDLDQLGRPGVELDTAVLDCTRRSLPVRRRARHHHHGRRRRQRFAGWRTGNNVDFPASSPHVLACGGTKLEASGATIASEVVWNETAANEGATGGGVSTVFALPTWQANASVPHRAPATGGRGVPDVAGDADPTTGYTIRVDGQTMVIGGTSAVAPLWAGLIAVANQQLGTTVGFINPPSTRPRPRRPSTTSPRATTAPSRRPRLGRLHRLGSPYRQQLIPLACTRQLTPHHHLATNQTSQKTQEAGQNEDG